MEGRKAPVSGMFPGTITDLYYFENEGQMLAENIIQRYGRGMPMVRL